MAVEHLHATEEKLRRKLAREAEAAAAWKLGAAVAAAEKRGRRELERERSKREQGLERTIALLQRHNEDLERRLDGLGAFERGVFNEAQIANDLAVAFPDDEITREGKGGDIIHVVQYRIDRKLERADVILYECKDTKRWSNGFVIQVKGGRSDA